MATVRPLYGLIDANSFYCSCEIAFRPELRGRPVVVLSNNDGCAIARTSEAKKLGIRMGDAWHLVRNRPELKDVVWFSSNYALYGDMSRRVYDVICQHIPTVEPYSIDEMFLDLTGLPDLSRRLHDLRQDVLRKTRIPTCIGLGPTKTISKLANGLAKDNQGMAGICDMSDPLYRARLYRELPVSEVWGVGRRTSEKLQAGGIVSISQFLAADPKYIRRQLSVVGERIQQELAGTPCLEISEIPAPRQGVTVSRSFGQRITRYEDAREAVASFALRVGEKLRAESLMAGTLAVFLSTGRHGPAGSLHSSQKTITMRPTNSGPALVDYAVSLLERQWVNDRAFLKAGVMAMDITHESSATDDLFASGPGRDDRLSAVMDIINARHGRGSISLACAGARAATPVWKPRQNMLSPRYTTEMSEIAVVRA